MKAPRPKVLIAYAEVTGYALACWQALADRRDIDLRVVCASAGLSDRHNRFSLAEVPAWLRLLGKDEIADPQRILKLAQDFGPEIVVISGWDNPAYRELAFAKRQGSWKIVLALDTSLHRPVRQLAGRLRLTSLLRHVDYYFVPGERGREFLRRWWRIPHRKIRNGLYGTDVKRWNESHAARTQQTWPRSFLFAGRYVESKGVNHLLDAYGIYRGRVSDPMQLFFCGAGPLREKLMQTAGTVDLGFVQPAQLTQVFSEAGCFVLPSTYDPWPLAILDACAAGLPVIAGVGCGSAVELLRDGYNGYSVKEIAAEPLADALVTMHRKYQEWPVMGARSASLAEPYTSECWAANFADLVSQVGPRPCLT